MRSNVTTHKLSGIAKLFQMTKNKFNNIKLVNNWIKYNLDPFLKAVCDKLRLKLVWLVTLPLHTPNIFSSVLSYLQK